jgi:hypothetical protein
VSEQELPEAPDRDAGSGGRQRDLAAGRLSRRAALARLGLGAAVAYAAPTLVRIDRSANAQILPTPCQPPGRGNPGGNPVHCPPGGGSPGGGPPGGGPG